MPLASSNVSVLVWLHFRASPVYPRETEKGSYAHENDAGKEL